MTSLLPLRCKFDFVHNGVLRIKGDEKIKCVLPEIQREAEGYLKKLPKNGPPCEKGIMGCNPRMGRLSDGKWLCESSPVGENRKHR